MRRSYSTRLPFPCVPGLTFLRLEPSYAKMKNILLTTLLLFAAVSSSHAEDGMISMFNGKDLSGWKSNARAEGRPTDVFSVKNGELVVSGGRAHLFYVGADGKASFRNFEFKAKVKTTPGSNGGIYFHTVYQDKGWPAAGYECQVNATHTDRKKTGGLYAVADVMDSAPHKDNEWFDYSITVDGRHIVVSINGKVTADWTQPKNWDPAKTLSNSPGRKIGEGTIAIQGHDPKSVTYYKELFIRPLP
jgi:opacity protein-like surface antigen